MDEEREEKERKHKRINEMYLRRREEGGEVGQKEGSLTESQVERLNEIKERHVRGVNCRIGRYWRCLITRGEGNSRDI